MKKVLALVLAVVLAFGMTTVAFAANKADEVKFVKDSGGNPILYTFDDGKAEFVNSNSDLDADKEYFIQLEGSYTNDKKVETPIIIDKSSVLNDVKVRCSVDEGNGYIAAKPAFVIKKVDSLNEGAEKAGKLEAGKKFGFVAFKTADKFQMEDKDFEMTITLYDKDGNANESAITLDGTIGYGTSEAKTFFRVGGPVVSFDDIDGEIEMEFGDDKAYFTVNADGQKDLFLRLDDSDDALEDKYPEASIEIRYFAGNNKTFRRSGELKINADMVEGKDGKMVAPFIYENNKGKLSVCKDAKYDSDKEAFIIKTNKLGNYVISDKELKVEEAKEDGKTDDKDGAEKNPDTGANDFVGLAVALAVVSVAGIAVAKRK